MFTFLPVRGLFLRSEAPGLVFSATYLWGSSAPSAFSACGGAAASPTDKSRKNGGLPPVTSEKPHDPRMFDVPCKQFDAPSSNSETGYEVIGARGQGKEGTGFETFLRISKDCKKAVILQFRIAYVQLFDAPSFSSCSGYAGQCPDLTGYFTRFGPVSPVACNLLYYPISS